MSTAPSTAAIQPLGTVGAGAKAQATATVVLGTAIDTAGTGGAVDVSGINGARTLQLYNSGSDTIAVNVQFTNESWSTVASGDATWTNARFNVLGSTGVITPSAGAQTIAATSAKTLALLDAVPTIRIVTSSANSGCSLRATLHLVPQ